MHILAVVLSRFLGGFLSILLVIFIALELTSKHADALAVLEQKLTKQLDETRGEKRELEEKMNSEIEEKVEVCLGRIV